MTPELFGLDLHIRQLDLGYGYTISFGVRLDGKTSFYNGSGSAPTLEQCVDACVNYLTGRQTDTMENQCTD